MDENLEEIRKNNVLNLPQRPAVEIEFQDLTYTVPQGRKGSKLILRSISGKFRSGQLTAILGPSGSGKSTLLNILAGYKCREATGTILINGEPRNLKEFREIARYIMQEDLIQPLLSVDEAMMIAANLKLGKHISVEDKSKIILDILELLRLSNTRNTHTNKLSGGERKRLSIALELLNNPPVLFLDEPTTGLDDLSCSQCVSLLKQLAAGGRTVICSIHTPSAKLFSMFDKVYVISSGQCTYQGYGPEAVPYLSTLGITCPTHYNPADFIMEVCSGEYGDCQDKMVSAIDNGRNEFIKDSVVPLFESTSSSQKMEIFEIVSSKEGKNSSWDQFKILLMRMWVQMWRNKSYLLLKVVLHIILGLLIGNLYIGIGEDGSKTIFNFGFFFTCVIFFMYIPMMPVLLSFPLEIQYLKREHFNQWYSIGSYFCALTVSTLPVQMILGSLYLSMVYIFSYQPLEIERIVPFFAICFLTSIISESFGLLISSTLNLLNGMFVGPVMMVPFIVFSAYGFGEGYASIPILIKIMMRFSYLRYSFEALVLVMLRGRKLQCPEEEEFCIFTDLDEFIEIMAMNNSVIWVDIVALIIFLVLVRSASFYLLRQRLTPNKTFMALQYIGRFIKTRMSEGR
ncbi:ATP-binding cassette sub-family G member 1 [Tribolium castaneum]|uniref:Protein white-like Protein n=1 Tax=Tribolium castaneum TaxID=7070 RepID=D1ZZE4_TRICA|nr:PREDICTED: ATP-binding cassette sub-family G member 1 [Tribolium castaneum]EFA01864.1 Protein white-like Protein [Tribolium castaneum]|eukprot:XP_015834971.1 PREDICTED: ATP-binding cassette sub-family G member 1 [Tribolium castaneum]